MAEAMLIEERTGFGLATVMARGGVTPAAIPGALGLPALDGPRVSRDGARALIGTGPGAWLAHADDAAPDWADDLRTRLDGLASVSDQSGSYTILRLSGSGARTLLQRGAAIDFHPDAFGPGSVAVTVIAHIGVIIWQVDALPTYDVAVFRSFGPSFRHWVQATAATL